MFEITSIPIRAEPFFEKLPRMKGLVFYDLETAVKECLTTPYALERTGDLQDACVHGSENYWDAGDRGGKTIAFSCSFMDEPEWVFVSGVLKGGKLLRLESMSHYRSYSSNHEPAVFKPDVPLDEYQLQALKLLWNHIVSSKSQDRTDGSAHAFFKAMDSFSTQAAEEARQDSEIQAVKERVLTLFPRIIVEYRIISFASIFIFPLPPVWDYPLLFISRGSLFIFFRHSQQCCIQPGCHVISAKLMIRFVDMTHTLFCINRAVALVLILVIISYNALPQERLYTL